MYVFSLFKNKSITTYSLLHIVGLYPLIFVRLTRMYSDSEWLVKFIVSTAPFHTACSVLILIKSGNFDKTP